MPEVTREQAQEMMTAEVRRFEPDELLEVYNEVFPDAPLTDADVRADAAPLVKRLVEHIHSGMEIAPFMRLWRLIILRHHDLWYNEVDDMYHYNESEDAETVWSD